MSLDEKIEKTPLEFIDEKLVGIHGKIAKLWQDKTYKSKDVLTNRLHGTSAALFGASIVPDHYHIILPFLAESIKYVYQFKTRISCDVEEQANYEAIKVPFVLPKALNLLIYTIGIGFTATSIGSLIHSTIIGDNDMFNKSLHSLTYGVGYLIWGTADYIDKANIEKPPKGPKRKSVKEWLKEKAKALIPESIPEPVTEPTRYSAHST